MGNAQGPWYIRHTWTLVVIAVTLRLIFASDAVVHGQSFTQAFIVEGFGPPVLTVLVLLAFVPMVRLPGQPRLSFGPLLTLAIVAMVVFQNLLYGVLIELPALAGVL
jgi:hypothetical protein